jgi:hypothetical protein
VAWDIGNLRTRLIMHIIPENIDQNMYWDAHRLSGGKRNSGHPIRI